jgi:hypothetical protein
VRGRDKPVSKEGSKKQHTIEEKRKQKRKGRREK